MIEDSYDLGPAQVQDNEFTGTAAADEDLHVGAEDL